jgi:HK97 family phage prohead protease
MLKFEPASDIEMKSLAVGENVPDGYVAGWASTPDLDSYRHVVKTGAFDESIALRGLNGPKGVKLLMGHDWEKVAGLIKVLETRKKKLWIEAQLNLNISYARDLYEATKMVGGLNFSVGFMLQDYQIKEDANEAEYLEIKSGDLFEVSIVPFPGNEEATMEFIKSRQAKEEESDDDEYIENRAAPSWKSSGSRNLPLAKQSSWDGAGARSRMFKAAGFDGDSPNYALVRRGHLAYDSANPDIRASYKLPFADMVGGKLSASSAGVRAAASRLPQTHIPDSVKKSARAKIESYQRRFKNKSAPEEVEGTMFATVSEFEKALVACGLVDCRNDAKRVTLAVKSAAHLFRLDEKPTGQSSTQEVSTVNASRPIDPPEDHTAAPVLATDQLNELSTLLAKMRGILAPVAK